MSTIRRTEPDPQGIPPEGTNLVVLRGLLNREPEQRELPSGSVVLAFDITVRPPADAQGGGDTPRAESVPVAWFDPPVAAARLAVGDDVVVLGRVRRRFFRAGATTASRTEVVAAKVVPARSRAKVRASVASSCASLLE